MNSDFTRNMELRVPVGSTDSAIVSVCSGVPEQTLVSQNDRTINYKTND